VSSPAPFQIPIVDLRAQYAVIRDAVRRAFEQVNESQQFILGPAVQNFEAQMAAYLDCRDAVGVASGSDALLLALMALGIGPGDAVITSPFTFFSTVSSITRLGATPWLVDIDPESFLMNAELVEAILTEPEPKRSAQRFRAILPVHLFGQCCAMNKLLALARKHRLHIVEDVAQACGARMVIGSETKFAGAIGDLGCLSFFSEQDSGWIW
jgi:dTDP-4-amino-4,6-dideoxygalactose transaminase